MDSEKLRVKLGNDDELPHSNKSLIQTIEELKKNKDLAIVLTCPLETDELLVECRNTEGGDLIGSGVAICDEERKSSLYDIVDIIGYRILQTRGELKE